MVFPVRPYRIYGLHPYEIDSVLGKALACDVDADTIVKIKDIEL